MHISKLVGVFDLAPIDAGETSESLKFRIEVLQDLGKKRSFYARIYRRETLRVKSTFPVGARQSPAFTADHEILVADDAIGAMTFDAASPALVLRKVRARVAEVFAKTKP